ncbi:MAG: filamentous hemagglutinin N-terminal domain-containing protein [Symploca sp. SIO1C2]|nr:filamentous hemagglutinin N-terminal domain-containing protein [Symploca sp. SIO1C2]
MKRIWGEGEEREVWEEKFLMKMANWQNGFWKLWLATALIVSSTENNALAQIVPDETLDNENSVVVPDAQIRGRAAELIEGGAIRNINLFHSFLEFNVNEGQRVYFANPVGIENILTRVTGSNASEILGTLGVDGAANLFLLNPNGIIFGKGAELDLRGSFVGSTADSILFGDGEEFSAREPEAAPLLKINVPIGLQYGLNHPAPVVNAASLEVEQGQGLTLTGGTVVNTDTGELIAPGGRISLAGVPRESVINLEMTGQGSSVDLPDDTTQVESTATALAALLEGAGLAEAGIPTDFQVGTVAILGSVDASDSLGNGGEVTLTGNRIRLLEGVVKAGGITGGEINLTSTLLENRGEIRADGEYGGSLTINTSNLLDAGVLSATGSAGDGGRIEVQYQGTVIQTASALTSVTGSEAGGRIEFEGGRVLTTSGNLEAKGELGGEIHLFGERLQLLATEVNASGNSGGGEILVGGDYQGNTVGAENALKTFVNYATTLQADGLQDGDGGRIIVWADETTGFYGEISARGGSNRGNGGFVEVSGKQDLIFRGEVDTIAPQGNWGTLLLDPENIIIVDGVGADDGELADDEILYTDSPGETFTISQGTLEAINSEVLLEASNDIIITPGVSLDFDNDFFGSAGAIAFKADADADGVGEFLMDVGDDINTNGRDLTISGASVTTGNIYSYLKIFGTIPVTAGEINLTSSNGNITTGELVSGDVPAGGDIILQANGNISTHKIESDSLVDAGGDIILQANGNINTYNLDAESALGNGGKIQLTAGGNISTRSIDADSNFGNTSNIEFTAGGNISTRSIDADSDLGAGENIKLTANGNIAIDGIDARTFGNSSNIELTAGGDISIRELISVSSVAGNGGAITLTSHNGGINTTKEVNSGSIAGKVGAIAFNARGDITTANIFSSSLDGNSGQIYLNSSSGAIDTTAGILISGSPLSANGAAITLTAADTITTNEILSLGDNGAGNITLLTNGKITTLGDISSASNHGNSGQISLTSNHDTIDTTVSTLNAISVAGNGGAIAFNAQGDITTANLSSSSRDRNSGEISLNSSSGAIDTTAGTLNSGSVAGKVAAITLTAADTITTNEILSVGDDDGGNITLHTNGKITTLGDINSASNHGNSGQISLTSNNDAIDTTASTLNSGSLAGNGATITLTAADTITTNEIVSVGDNGGGNITLNTNGKITTLGDLSSASNQGNSGQISLTSNHDTIDTTASTLNSISVAGNGGAIAFNAQGDITTANLSSSSRDRNSGEISLNSNSGAIETTAGILNSGSLAGNGAIITLTAADTITTNEIVSVGNDDGGNIALSTNGQITTLGDISSSSNNGNSGQISLTSNNDAIYTTASTLNSISVAGDGGAVTLNANSDISIGNIQSFSIDNGDGGEIKLTSHNGIVNTTVGTLNSGSVSGHGGAITVAAERDITTANIFSISQDGDSGAISLISNNGGINTTTGILNSGSLSGNGAAITVAAEGNIITGDTISASNDGNGGKIEFNSNRGAIDTSAGTLLSAANTGNAGEIALTADSNLIIRNIQSISNRGNGGGIKLTSHNGAIEARGGIVNSGSISQNAGDIAFTASGNITLTGIINTNGNPAGGDITLLSNNGAINAELLLLNSGSLRMTNIGILNANGVQLPPTVSATNNLNAGAIALSARDGINLTTAFINASRAAGSLGKGGSINLNSSDGDISLANTFLRTETSVGTGGNITFGAESVSLTNSNAIIRTHYDAQAGNINITTKESVDFNRGSGLFIQNQGTQPNGNLTIKTPTLRVRGGSILSTSAHSVFPTGSGGILTVNADSVEISGTSQDGLIPSSLASVSLGQSDDAANGGEIRINANQLTLRDGGSVSGSTVGKGKGGDVTINADSVMVTGTSENQLFASGLSVEALGDGEAGNLMIEANQLLLQDGGIVSASTFGDGNGGMIDIKVSELSISGASSDNQIKSGIYSQSFDAGNAGSIDIITDELLVQDGARITVNSQPTSENSGNLIDKTNALIEALKKVPEIEGIPPDFSVANGSGSGDAGDINIEANNILLHNQGQITAVTSSGEGGNIGLDVSGLILMRHNSLISATAGTAPGGGNGGNITLNAPFIIGIPAENSDITANAFTGNGGRITITTQAIFGLEFREQLTPFSDITASSELGLSGIVEINQLSVDPSQGLSNLPDEPGTPQPLQGCRGGGIQSGGQFISIGRQGIPTNPYESLDSSDVWEDLQPAQELAENPTAPPEQIVEATGWIVTEEGEVILVAEMPSADSRVGCVR